MCSAPKEKGFIAKFQRVTPSGFALVAALLAMWILTALGLLVFTMTTQDVRDSSRMVGEKKAFAATEAGIGQLVQKFDPSDLPASAVTMVKTDPNDGPDSDPASRYSIDTPTLPTYGPAAIQVTGYAIGGGETWGQDRFLATVTGTNTNYNSRASIAVGVGYGPVPVTTQYR